MPNITSPSIHGSYTFNQPNSSVCEYSTLIYSLAEEAPITFDQFNLIIRSLHGYKVDKIIPDKTTSTTSVGLHYFASVTNARKKLGPKLAEFIGIERVSENVKTCELQDLQRLRALYQFGGPIEEDEPATRKPNKKRRY